MKGAGSMSAVMLGQYNSEEKEQNLHPTLIQSLNFNSLLFMWLLFVNYSTTL